MISQARQGVSNYRQHGCLFNKLFRLASMKTSLSGTTLPVWGWFPSQRSDNTESISMSSCHHGIDLSPITIWNLFSEFVSSVIFLRKWLIPDWVDCELESAWAFLPNAKIIYWGSDRMADRENVCIFIQISLKFIRKSPTNKYSALVPIMT